MTCDWTNPDGRIKLLHGDCMIRMSELQANSVEAIITDPPYGLAFMGKEWDDLSKQKLFHHKWAVQALRVLKPGGFLLACGGTRTYHRMVVAIEDVGFRIRDQLQWIYASGFPKSLDISKSIDKKLGASDQREVIGYQTVPDMTGDNYGQGQREYTQVERTVTKAATEQAQQWEGWGTALKPAFEPICMAQKPLYEKTVAENVMRHGVGGINIDASRIGNEIIPVSEDGNSDSENNEHAGRWPSNIILGCFCENDQHESDCPVYILDKQSGYSQSKRSQLTSKPGTIYGGGAGLPSYTGQYGFNDGGGASRFFYTAKASVSERRGSNHPTVKPVELMKYLVMLVTPPGGTVLDPFCGSGTTLEAAYICGFRAIGIEQDEENLTTIMERHKQMTLELF